MGCFLSSSSSAVNHDPEREVYADNEKGSSEIAPELERRSGAAGLLDMGFEYRPIPCEKHTDNFGSSRSDRSAAICYECATRLFHVESGTMITDDAVRKKYISDGSAFDDVSRVCQELAQDRVRRELSLKFVTLCDGGKGPVRALVDDDWDVVSDRRPIFLFITGRGKSRAGVVSVREVLVSGIERGSALFHLREAKRRGFSVACLDPNALGENGGMAALERSLTALFRPGRDKAPIYVLAHSAAGGFLVRYLVLGATRGRILPNLQAVAFTDSTHRLPWAREDPALFSFLQSPRCLYVRNDTARESSGGTGGPGEVVRSDVWWRSRFGELRTVWAGTASHSAMCWVAREIIWNFFDQHIS